MICPICFQSSNLTPLVFYIRVLSALQMPAIRINAAALHCEMEHLGLGDTGLQHDVAHDEFSLRKRASARPVPPPSPSAASVAKPTKKKKSSNAFILFRSHAIANHMLPESVKHQNDVSRMVAELWRGQDDATRAHFFKMADREKARRAMEELIGIPDEVVVKKKKTRTVQPAQIKSREARRTTVQMPTPPPTPGPTTPTLLESHTLPPIALSTDSTSPASPSPTSSVDAHLLSIPKISPEELRVAPFHLPHLERPVEFSPPTSEADIFSFAPEWSATQHTSSLSFKSYAYGDPTGPLESVLDLHLGSSPIESESSPDLFFAKAFHPHPDCIGADAPSPPPSASVAAHPPALTNNAFMESILGLTNQNWDFSGNSQTLDLDFDGGIMF
ncbi:hypothetical protein DFH11DRAFT_104662 [Phellopilus nigrolimitatus]|nr:hypothetical protein DFH11DRAFT_104662 [Phellopilus nigrolimitatus]